MMGRMRASQKDSLESTKLMLAGRWSLSAYDHVAIATHEVPGLVLNFSALDWVSHPIRLMVEIPKTFDRAWAVEDVWGNVCARAHTVVLVGHINVCKESGEPGPACGIG
jgi:hypothetical protein